MATHSSILAWEIPWTGVYRTTVHGVAKNWTELSNPATEHAKRGNFRNYQGWGSSSKDIFLFFLIFIEFATLLLLFYGGGTVGFVFGQEACGILASWPGIKSAPAVLEGEILTTGSPGKSAS